MSDDLPRKNKSVSYLKENIENFTKYAAGTNLSELQEWLDNEQSIERFHANLKKEQVVYTLLSAERSKMIQRFFHVPKIKNTSSREVPVKQLLESYQSSGILINGRLGQGKSILLRYLHFLELNSGLSIPVFLEFRKIKNGSQILDEACKKINFLGLSCSEKLFDFLMSEGRISLFLDGFDEISLEAREDFNTHLSKICSQYSSSKILVTSRYDTEVSKNTSFKRFEIKLLKKDDIAPFVKKILSGNSSSRAILAKIKESEEFDYSVLDTPLMITWFIVVYNKRLKIPKTKLGFYEDLFSAILSRHDGFKDSYNRASKTKLSDDEIKDVFCTFCYLARKEQQRIFSESRILRVIRQSLNVSGFTSVDPSEYLYDLVHITCLLKRDGLDYEFIHESIAHYFSALFIESQMEENAREFYSNRVDDWRLFEGELEFLSIIDEVRFNKYFFVPNLAKVIGVKGSYLKREAVISIYSSAVIVMPNEVNSYENSNRLMVFTFFPDDYVIKKILTEDGYSVSQMATKILKDSVRKNNDLSKKLDAFLLNKDAVKRDSFSYCSLMGFLEHAQMLDYFIGNATPYLYDKFKKEFDEANRNISFEEKKRSLFS